MSGKLFQRDEIPTTQIESSKAVIVQQKIIDEILNKYPQIEYLKLGSVGKKDGYNGDIDIGIKTKDINELSNIIHNVFYYNETIENKSIYIISIKYEYEPNTFVAVDFILIKDINYTKFRYYCPNYKLNESKYKVGTKIMFVGTILNHCLSDEYLNIINTSATYEYLPIGLYMNLYERQTRTNINYLISLNPQEIVNIMFNDSNIDVCNSVETLWEAIHSDKFKYPDRLKSLEISFFINSYRKGWEEYVSPFDFKLTYWDPNDIIKKCEIHKKLRQINIFLSEL